MSSGKVRDRREEEDLEAAGAPHTKLGSLLTGHLFMDKFFLLEVIADYTLSFHDPPTATDQIRSGCSLEIQPED